MIKKYRGCLMDVKKMMRLMFCTSLLSLTVQANDESRIWSRVGPQGASINQVVISSNNPNILYAATDSSSYYSNSNEAILKSLNGGDSWVTLPWQGKALSSEIIVANHTYHNSTAAFYKPLWQGRTLAADANNSDTIFTSLSGVLLKTTDNGMNWHSIGETLDLNAPSFFLMNAFMGASLEALISPKNGIISSFDGGESGVLNKQSINTHIQQSIQPSTRYPEGESNIHLLTLNPDNRNILYGYTMLRHRSALALAPILLYKSIDQGDSWLNITPSGYRYLGRDFVFEPNDSNTLFSVFGKLKANSDVKTVNEETLMRSDDGGINWTALSVPTIETVTYDVTEVYLDASDSNIIYANIKPTTDVFLGSRHVIAKSVDSGESWKIIDISPYFSGALTIDPDNNEKLFIASKQGVLRSSDGGEKWALSNNGVQHIGGKLSVAEGNASVMYLAGYGIGDVPTGLYYKSTNGGKHWNRLVTTPIVSGACQEFKINPKDNQDIFCITDDNIYQSLDGGLRWEHLKNSGSGQLVRTEDGSIYFSDDKGLSKSKDNGVNWDNIPVLEGGKLSIHPKDPEILYYVLDNELHSSMDSGQHWSKLETPNNIDFSHLVIHTLDPDVMVLYGTYGYIRSDNGGDSWHIDLETVNNGNEDRDSFPAEFNFISELILDPVDIKGIFIKTSTGVYESSDQGAHWDVRNTGIESYMMNNYIGSHLYASSQDVYLETVSGIFKLTDKVNFTAISDCIFDWLEQGTPSLFSPTSVNSEQWQGYTFRYYSETEMYLGIFHEQEIHQLQISVSGDVIPQGALTSYQQRSGCVDDIASH